MPDLPPITRRVALGALLAGFFVAGLGVGIVITGGVSGAIYGNRGALSISGTNTGSALAVSQGGDATGIRSDSQGGVAGRFDSTEGSAVQGISSNPDADAISGLLDSTTAGRGAAVRGVGRAGIGVAGSTASATGAGVSGTSSGGGAGVEGVTRTGVGAGVVAVGSGSASAAGLVARSVTTDGFGLVTTGPAGTAAYVAGDSTVTGSQITGGISVGSAGLIAVNVGKTSLTAGTPVRVVGANAALIGSTPTLLVAAARPGDLVVGIVVRGLAASRPLLPGVGGDGQMTAGTAVTVLRPATGPVGVGSPMILATSGVVSGVRVDPGSTTVWAGQVLVLGLDGSLVPRAKGDTTTPAVALALNKVTVPTAIPVLLLR